MQLDIIANNDRMVADSIYKYTIVDNVINYSYEDFSVWRVHTDPNHNNVSDSDTNYYLIIDTHGHEAFAHWVFECAVYLPLFTKLKPTWPNIKLHLKCLKGYKSLFCDFFNINKDDITTTIETNNKCIFPNSITSLNHKTISDEYIMLVEEFSNYFKTYNVKKTIDIAFLPRQTKENYVNNNRIYNTSDIENNVKDNSNNIILKTDDITKLVDQIDIIKSSKNIILTGGSPYLVNGMFSENANIICLDDIVSQHACDHSKIKHIHAMILKQNCVTMIPNYETFEYSSIAQYIS